MCNISTIPILVLNLIWKVGNRHYSNTTISSKKIIFYVVYVFLVTESNIDIYAIPASKNLLSKTIIHYFQFCRLCKSSPQSFTQTLIWNKLCWIFFDQQIEQLVLYSSFSYLILLSNKTFSTRRNGLISESRASIWNNFSFALHLRWISLLIFKFSESRSNCYCHCGGSCIECPPATQLHQIVSLSRLSYDVWSTLKRRRVSTGLIPKV